MNIEQLKHRIEAARDGKVDLVLKNANVVNVCTNEIQRCDVAIYDGIIVGLGDYAGEREIDCEGAYLCPGFIDGHVHIESSMCCPPEFARIVLPKGTTSVIADPHEIANVSGLDGIRYFRDDSWQIGLHVFLMFPSCVPCTEFEENFEALNNEDAAALLYERTVYGLGEVMDSGAVLSCREDMIKKLNMFERRYIDGHAPGLSGRDLNAYIVAGATTDHEAIDFDEILEKLRAGMWVQIRVGSAANDMQVVLRKIAEHGLPTDHLFFCTDDKHTENILQEGHINCIARLAVQAGIDGVHAVKMASTNTAIAYGLRSKGVIAPGFDADLVLMRDLVDFEPLQVFVKGKELKELSIQKQEAPDSLKTSIHIAPMTAKSIELRLHHARSWVIEMQAGQLVTTLKQEEVPMLDGCFMAEGAYAKIICVERHHATGHIGVGIVKNFGLRTGAVASSVAHDSHNIVCIGMNDADMLCAVSALKEIGGGYVLVQGGKVLASIPLPIGGIVSDAPYEELVAYQSKFLHALSKLGVPQESDPLIRLSFFCLPVIPQGRVTTGGLFDVSQWKFLEY